MIRSFGDKLTEALFRDDRVRQFTGFARVAKRKLEALNAANRLEDLTIPPSNRLERLKGDLKEKALVEKPGHADPDQVETAPRPGGATRRNGAHK